MIQRIRKLEEIFIKRALVNVPTASEELVTPVAVPVAVPVPVCENTKSLEKTPAVPIPLSKDVKKPPKNLEWYQLVQDDDESWQDIKL